MNSGIVIDIISLNNVYNIVECKNTTSLLIRTPDVRNWLCYLLIKNLKTRKICEFNMMNKIDLHFLKFRIQIYLINVSNTFYETKPVWILWCLRIFECWLKVFLHTGHENSGIFSSAFPSSWVNKCSRYSLAVKKTLMHAFFGHVRSICFSPFTELRRERLWGSSPSESFPSLWSLQSNSAQLFELFVFSLKGCRLNDWLKIQERKLP